MLALILFQVVGLGNEPGWEGHYVLTPNIPPSKADT